VTTLAVAEGTAAVDWSVWTTDARLVVTDPAALEPALTLVRDRLDEIDGAASRFRRDSEVSLIAASDREVHHISPLLHDLVRVALEAAEQTGGVVDPTLGQVLTHLGYGPAGVGSGSDGPEPSVRWRAQRRATWRDVALDGDTVSLPPGTLLDLGATAKAVAADRCAEEVAQRFGCGALVSLGGDLSCAGAEPPEGWNVLVQDGDDEPASLIRLSGASAVATSSTLRRRWQHEGRQMHHLLDPMTLLPARPVWRTVTVAAESCLRANTLSTQAVVVGSTAPSVLAEAGVAARLVAADGGVTRLGGWPG
jgi:thiamine biosynthesis lipoprotein